ncbi:hypothetical protein MRB53_004714 [Persea americana]|uniref:Uncharacterized protein n=1 Tax=Persea americana TaxID=3435 RepID=A0ACC2MC57_PERAE|nr:hypothetical protein MRB53_004714 [Persea americana]
MPNLLIQFSKLCYILMQTELLEAAVKGTLNVLKVCSETGVERVVVVSSVGAVMMNPDWPPNRPMDEDCWSDIDYCRESKIELLEPAVRGTLNVLKACSETGVERVVVVSSTSAVLLNPNWPPNRPMDEDCWSDVDYCRESQTELLEPAVRGTLNVLKACSETGVERVVVVSTIGAVLMNPNWPPNKPMDEDCWTDIDYCRESKLGTEGAKWFLSL